MRFVDAEVLIGSTLAKVASYGILSFTESDFAKLNALFMLAGRSKDRVICSAERKDFIDFADANEEFVTYNRALNTMIVKKDMAGKVVEEFGEKYLTKLRKVMEDEQDEVLNLALKNML